MVTVEQDSIQSQVGNSNPQTQNPQTLVPTNLQPNSTKSENLQNVNPASLFNNPQANAVVTVSGSSGGSVEAFIASETTPKNNTNTTPGHIWLIIGTAFFILVGSFLIIKNFLPKKSKR